MESALIKEIREAICDAALIKLFSKMPNYENLKLIVYTKEYRENVKDNQVYGWMD